MESPILIFIQRLTSAFNRLFNNFVSVPIFIKILGAGMFVVLIFGSIVLYRTRISMARTLYQELEDQTRTVAVLMAASLERSMTINDYLSAKLILDEAKQVYPSIEYAIVEDQSNRIVAHTFNGNVPADLVELHPPARMTDKKATVEVLGSSKGFIMEAAMPLTHGALGRVRIGQTDRYIRERLFELSWLLLFSTILCAILGLGLAIVLAYLITRPIKNLLVATNLIGKGDFSSRARIFWNDEIGRFAAAFNLMAENLQKFRQEVDEKEATRQALLEKLIFIQEQERRRIAQDLHDQLGQSLSVLLMEARSMDNGSQSSCEKHQRIEQRLAELIDEVRQLAWGMHPAILDDYGLDKALERYINTISKSTRMDIDYQCLCHPNLERLPLRTEVALYRIAQEAITNIVRHAHTNQASVVFMRNANETVLLIEDEGKGFDRSATARDDFTHMGLHGMIERASMLGGEFTVESAPGQGTTIRVKLQKELLS